MIAAGIVSGKATILQYLLGLKFILLYSNHLSFGAFIYAGMLGHAQSFILQINLDSIILFQPVEYLEVFY